jgi:hypothetical protein
VSIDLDIAPLRATRVGWGPLLRAWRQRLGDEAAALLGPDPKLRVLGAGAAVAEDAALEPPGHYSLDLAAPNTLSLSAMPNKNSLDEIEYLKDYARNLEPRGATALALSWRGVGYYYEVSSGGGRSTNEPALFVTLACALADICDGRIIVMNDGIFDLGVGVYTAEQFASVRWLHTGPARVRGPSSE